MDSQRGNSPFGNRDFRLLFGGSSISMIGDQFTLVALPWLVLQLTGEPAQLGLVLAVMALPRAAFMLVGGAVVDRLSPRGVLLTARAANAVLAGLLAGLVLAGSIQMWTVYLLAFAIGLCTAFAYPAAGSILPQILPPKQLQAANSMIMGMRQLSMLIGPALAGLLVTAGSARAGAAPGAAVHGTGLAFAVDAVSFLFSVVSLLAIHIASERQARAAGGGVLTQVFEAIRWLWQDVQLRSFIAYMAFVSILVMGPLQVGLPLFAKARFAEGAAAFGWLMTVNGTGMLLGSVLPTSVTRMMRGRLGIMVLCCDGAAALAGGLLSLISISQLFIGAGLSLTALAMICLTRPSLRAICLQTAPV